MAGLMQWPGVRDRFKARQDRSTSFTIRAVILCMISSSISVSSRASSDAVVPAPPSRRSMIGKISLISISIRKLFSITLSAQGSR